MSKLFSDENKAAFTGPLNVNNPVAVQVLGICSALAVTSQLKPAIVMGLRDGHHGILECDYIPVAQDYSQPHPHHRAACGCGCSCDNREPTAQGIRL